jgi:hypothetical protein
MPEFENLFQKAKSAVDEGQYATACTFYREAIESDPHHPKVMTAIKGLERYEGIVSAHGWYGDSVPQNHAAGILASIPLERNAAPYVHHMLFGRDAYDAFHIVYYLNNLLRFRRFQLIQPAFMLLWTAMLATKAARVEFVELGSSLHAAVEKFQNCRAFLGGDGPDIRHIGIEMSERLRLLGGALHPETPVEFYPTWTDVPPALLPRFAFSIGVANYAFRDHLEFAQWLDQNTTSVVRERFTFGADVETDLVGKRFVCFDIDTLTAALRERGVETIVLAAQESPAFIRAGSSVPMNRKFVDAHVLFHRLSADAVGDMTARVDSLDRLRSLDPELPLGPGLLAGKSLADIRWRRRYQRNAARGHRYDFSGTTLPAEMFNAVSDLNAAYNHELGPVLKNLGKGKRTLHTRIASLVRRLRAHR